MSPAKRNYVLLGRDGVINRRTAGGVTSWSQFEFLPRALEGLQLLQANGWTVLVVSNQPGVGTGALSGRELEVVTQRFVLEVALAGGWIANVYYCPHTEASDCFCRKPSPGLLQRAMSEHRVIAQEAYMIGDCDCDMEAAVRAGCRGIRLRRDTFLSPGVRCEEGNEAASNLYEAAKEIVTRGLAPSDKIVSAATFLSRIEDPTAISLLDGTEGTCS